MKDKMKDKMKYWFRFRDATIIDYIDTYNVNFK